MTHEVMLKMEEAIRLGILRQTLAGVMTVQDAAQSLHLSERQIYRLRSRMKCEGEACLRHGNRDRTSSQAKPETLRRRVIELYRTEYDGYNFTHFSEALSDEHGIRLSDETIRRWLRAEQLGGNIRRTRKHRKRRERKAREGELLFLDGSPHHWFGDEEPACTLLLVCDDATGKPLAGLFRDQEDRDGCFLVMAAVFKAYGLPNALYLDRASQFKTTRHEGLHSRHVTPGPTHFQRAMEELGVHLIFSHSPQARGRIERLNGVFQDRLIAELRHHGITTLPEANRYLNKRFIPAYVKRFAVKPRDPRPAWKPIPEGLDLFDVMCVKEFRVVANDNTISYQGSLYQLQPAHGRTHFVKAKVEVRSRPDGGIQIHHPKLGRIPARKINRCSKVSRKPQDKERGEVYAQP